MSRKKGIIFGGTVVLIVLLSIGVISSLALPGFNVDANGFEIDENLKYDSSFDADWETAIHNTTGDPIAPYIGPGLISDEIYSVPGFRDSTHFAGGDKFLNPAGWDVITKNGGSSQTELENAYVVADFVNGSPILYVGFTRLKEEGDFHLDVEVNRSAPTSSGVPQRGAGDFAVLVDILKNPVDGGDLVVSVIQFTSPSTYTVVHEIDQSGVTDLQAQYDTTGVVAVMNSADFQGNFNNLYLNGNENWVGNKFVEEFTFVEMAVDLSELGIEPACPGFAWVHLKSRASDAVNSDLKDLVGPEEIPLDTCGSKTFDLDFNPFPIDGLRYYAVYDHTPSNPADVGGIGDLGSGEVELTGPDYDFTFDTVAPGTLDYHFEVRKSDGSTVILASPGESETIENNEDAYNPGSFTYSIDLSPNGVNEVGTAHNFTATLTGSLCGTACTATVPLAGVDIYYSVTFTDTTSGTSVSPASPQVSNASGQITFTVNSNSVQTANAMAWVNSAAGSSDDFESGEAVDNAHKDWVDVRISISPLSDDNEVGTDHVLTITLEKSVEAGVWIPFEGETVYASITNEDGATAAFVGGDDDCVTDGSGQCTVTINSPTTGSTTIEAEWGPGLLDGTYITARYSDPDADKDWVAVRISISPLTDDNEAGTNHILTIKLEKSVVDGVWTAFNGETVSATITANELGATAAFVGSNSCITSGEGECTVTINSPTAGSTTVEASWAGGTVEGASITAKTTDPDADKDWVKVRISITPATDDNEVSTNHDLTITLEKSVEEGVWTALNGETVSASLTNHDGATASFVGPNTCETAGSGQCTVTINSPTPGKTTVEATWAGGTVEGAAISAKTTEPDADKYWVDAYIAVSPLTDTNGIGEEHRITATVWQDDGRSVSGGGDGTDGWAPAPDGTLVTFSLLNNTAGASFVGGVNTCTTTSGSCYIDINSDAAGSVDIHATTTFFVASVELTRATGTGGNNSADANKVYVDGSLIWYKRNPQGDPVGGATFEVCRTHDRFGVAVSDPCITVEDDSSPDVDGDPGEFKLVNLYLGRYTITETVPPAGYAGDPFVETIELTLNEPNKSATHIWINVPNQGCTPGYWKQEHHFDSWVPTGYDPNDPLVGLFSSVGVAPYADHYADLEDQYPDVQIGVAQLVEALRFAGGGSTVPDKAEILLRAAVAAVLNAAHPGVAYYYSDVNAIVTLVNDALNSQNETTILNLAGDLDQYNNASGGCPLN